MRRSGRQYGFTLVELLVALLVTVMVVGSAAAILRTVAQAREVTENRLHSEQAATQALRTITTALRNAYRSVSDQDALFDGGVDASDPVPRSRVRFRTVERRIIRPGQPESDVHEVEFFLRDCGSSWALMRRSDPTRNLPPDRGGVVEPLALDILGLDLQYLDSGQWLDRWQESQSWPAAVSVRLIYRVDETGSRTASVSRIVNFPHWNQSAGALDGAVKP